MADNNSNYLTFSRLFSPRLLPPTRLAPDIVVDDMGGSSPSHGRMGGSDGYRGGGGGGDNTKLPIVMLQGFFRGPGDRSPHHRRPSMVGGDVCCLGGGGGRMAFKWVLWLTHSHTHVHTYICVYMCV